MPLDWRSDAARMTWLHARAIVPRMRWTPLAGLLVVACSKSVAPVTIVAQDATVVFVYPDAQMPEDAAFAPDVDFRPDATLPADAGVVDAGRVDPGPPMFPPTIDTLTIDLRTGYGTFDGTDANSLAVCLTDVDCFPLNIAAVDDFRPGELDVYAFENVQLPRSAVDRVEIRSANGSDLWRPNCLALTFDGEPVYCENRLGMAFGEEPGELTSWVDPAGLHRQCNRCFDAAITHGPMLGAVGPDEARVLFRTDATRRVVVRVARADEIGASRVADWRYPSAQRDFTDVVHFKGLEPNTEYAYFFEVEGQLAPGLHTFRTAPPAGSSGRTRIAFGSCTRDDEQPIFAHVRALHPDLFVFIGDNHYANTDDLNGLRWHYRWGMSRSQRAQMLAEASVLATWDDHDFTGNNTDGTASGKDVALRVFTEYWANPSAGTPATPGVFFKHAHGDVDFFFLDDRYYRGFDDSMLGAAQTAWLQDSLQRSTATFKLIFNGSQWTAAGSADSWASFLPARDAIFDFIRDQRVEGVVLLSGDVHRSELRAIERRTVGGYDLPEIVSSPMATSNSTCRASSELRTCLDSANYFVTLDIDTASAEASLTARIIDQYGRQRAEWRILRTDLEL